MSKKPARAHVHSEAPAKKPVQDSGDGPGAPELYFLLKFDTQSDLNDAILRGELMIPMLSSADTLRSIPQIAKKGRCGCAFLFCSVTGSHAVQAVLLVKCTRTFRACEEQMRNIKKVLSQRIERIDRRWFQPMIMHTMLMAKGHIELSQLDVLADLYGIKLKVRLSDGQSGHSIPQLVGFHALVMMREYSRQRMSLLESLFTVWDPCRGKKALLALSCDGSCQQIETLFYVSNEKERVIEEDARLRSLCENWDARPNEISRPTTIVPATAGESKNRKKREKKKNKNKGSAESTQKVANAVCLCCLAPIEPPNALVRLKCGHTRCRECLRLSARISGYEAADCERAEACVLCKSRYQGPAQAHTEGKRAPTPAPAPKMKLVVRHKKLPDPKFPVQLKVKLKKAPSSTSK